MKISKPTQYVIIVGGLLAVAGLGWNAYSAYQENNASQEENTVTSVPVTKPKPSAQAASPTPVAKASVGAKASPTPATKASPSPVAKASPPPVAKASPSPVAKASPTPVAKASPSPAAKASAKPTTDPFRDAVNKAMNAANLTQTASNKAQWSTVASNWQQAIDLMKSVPQANPKYQVAQQKITEYQNNLNYAKKASELAK
ncbi:MAG TPA: hypothetical protein V6C95_17650 [Coleofasciculaceae cyanobacterium]